MTFCLQIQQSKRSDFIVWLVSFCPRAYQKTHEQLLNTLSVVHFASMLIRHKQLDTSIFFQVYWKKIQLGWHHTIIMSPYAFILGVWSPRQTCSWVTDFKVLGYLLQLRKKYVSDLKLLDWHCWCLRLDQQALLYRKKTLSQVHYKKLNFYHKLQGKIK